METVISSVSAAPSADHDVVPNLFLGLGISPDSPVLALARHEPIQVKSRTYADELFDFYNALFDEVEERRRRTASLASRFKSVGASTVHSMSQLCFSEGLDPLKLANEVFNCLVSQHGRSALDLNPTCKIKQESVEEFFRPIEEALNHSSGRLTRTERLAIMRGEVLPEVVQSKPQVPRLDVIGLCQRLVSMYSGQAGQTVLYRESAQRLRSALSLDSDRAKFEINGAYVEIDIFCRAESYHQEYVLDSVACTMNAFASSFIDVCSASGLQAPVSLLDFWRIGGGYKKLRNQRTYELGGSIGRLRIHKEKASLRLTTAFADHMRVFLATYS